MSRGSNPTKVQQWSDRLERFENSVETVTQFCVAEGVSQPSFYRWKEKIGLGNRVRGGKSKRSGRSHRAERPNRRSTSESTFKPVQLTPTPGLQQSTTIRLAAGVEIELGNNLQVVDVVVRSVVKQVLAGGAARAGGTPC
jgi:hypothetical protein